MSGAIGERLREWRLARGLTLGGLAARSHVHTSTLSRWESGKQQPSLRELDAVLATLDVSASQRREALEKLSAPRAIQRLRKEALDAPPVGGDLLRAMRMRRGWTQAEVAPRIGITQSLLAKWERSEDWPATERLHALCYALGAHPDEVSALSTGRVWLTSATEPAFPLQTLNERLHQVYIYRDDLTDLRFLTIEAGLWHQAQQSPAAHALQRVVFSYHARMLLETGRMRETEGILRRLQSETPPAEEHEETFPQTALVAAALTARKDIRRAVARLKDALGRVENVDYWSWMLGDLGFYLAQMGRAEATQATEAACRVTERASDNLLLYFRQRDHARALIALKRYGEAQTALEAASPLLDYSPDSQVRHHLLEVECLLGLEKRTEAQERLGRTMEVITRQGLDYLRSQADPLAKRF